MDHRYLKGEEKGKGMEGRGGGELKVEGGEGEKEPTKNCFCFLHLVQRC